MVDLAQLLFMTLIVVVTAQYYVAVGRKEGFQKGYTEGFFDSTSMFAENLGKEINKEDIKITFEEEPSE
jgi:hypothetical protein